MSLVKEIIENLTEGSISNDIEWKISSNIFNSDTQKYFESFSSDEKTKFVVQIYLDDKLKLSRTNFYIYNKDLVDGIKMFPSHDISEIEKLGKVIYDKYIKPNLPQKNDDDTYKGILSNIFSKQHKRDQRIDAILSGESKSLPENTHEVKPKSIINRLFGN